MTAAPHLWRGFQQIEDELSAHGVPRVSPRWRREVERYYLHPTATTWFACVGRGGGKNLVGIKCDLAELIFGDFAVPSGERHYQVNVGENREEAEKTLAQTARYLEMLDIPFSQAGATLDLGGELSDRGSKVLACRIGAVSGFRSTGATTQESAKWNNDGTNPAEEVATSVAAQTVTHPTARQRHFSTPMGRGGFFYDGFALGETDEQIVSQGTSWEFNPSITEAQCWKLARGDKRIFRREYMAEPQAGALSAFDHDAIDNAFAHPRQGGTHGRRHIVLDPSSGKKDAFTFGVCGWIQPPRDQQWRPYLKFEAVSGFEGSFWNQIDGEKIADAIANLAKVTDATTVHADQREELMLRAALERRKLSYVVHPWTSTSKPLAVERVRRWLAERVIALPDHKQLRSELLAFEERITPSGAFTFGARGSGHDDYVALLITAAMAELDGRLPSHAGGLIVPSSIGGGTRFGNQRGY